jgi:hypothetical protein
VLSYGAILATWLVAVIKLNRGGDPRCCDLAFALSLVAMLLLTPICWDHYLLLLALPLALTWIGLRQSSVERFAFLILAAALWLGPNELWRLGGVDLMRDWPDFHEVPAASFIIRRPLFVPFFLSMHFYALVACYVWMLVLARTHIAASTGRFKPS